MSEIEKMYKNVGIKNEYCHCAEECPYFPKECQDCENKTNPPFTTEKQIELIKWLASYGKYEPTRKLLLQCLDGEWYIAIYEGTDVKSNGAKVDFKECLARVINKIWQSLTSEEKQQVKGILE